MVADLEAELGVILLSFPTTQEIVVQLHQRPRGCEGCDRTDELKIASAPKGFQVKLDVVRRLRA
jgi:hypothetical protein